MTTIADHEVSCSLCFDTISTGTRMKLVKNGNHHDIVCMRCAPAVSADIVISTKPRLKFKPHSKWVRA
jgi:hypothetical protein